MSNAGSRRVPFLDLKAAYRELIRHYERPVYRLSYALTRSHDEATALAVETFRRGLAEITRMPEG